MRATRKVARTCNISIFLFGKPAWEMNLEGADVDYEMVEEIDKLSTELSVRLRDTSRLVKKLLDNGWTGGGGLYDLSLYKEQTLEETESELVRLGINPSDVDLEEEDWEEDDP